LPRVVNVFKLQRLIKPFRAKDKYLEMVPNWGSVFIYNWISEVAVSYLIMCLAPHYNWSNIAYAISAIYFRTNLLIKNKYLNKYWVCHEILSSQDRKVRRRWWQGRCLPFLPEE
jgi:hypothetical protein